MLKMEQRNKIRSIKPAANPKWSVDGGELSGILLLRKYSSVAPFISSLNILESNAGL